jgi:hypothetical protein
MATSLLGSRIHGTFSPALWVTGSTAPIRQPIGYQDPLHLSASLLGSRVLDTYPPAYWVAGSLTHIRQPIG